jgi:hypothetical protein
MTPGAGGGPRGPREGGGEAKCPTSFPIPNPAVELHENPGLRRLNPLFLYLRCGLGKGHCT